MPYPTSTPESVPGASSTVDRQRMAESQATDRAQSRSYGILDGSISFGRRTTARLPRECSTAEEYESEQYDFLALMTAVADLYSQDDVLEMQVRGANNVGKHIGSGAVSAVSSVFAAITRPSVVTSHQLKQRKHVVVLQKSAARLFLPNGGRGDADALRGFISEIRILSHQPLREHPNIIKLLGVHWELESGYPEPFLLLERANTDLEDFQSRHRSLPFSTKKSIALDIASGLSALHQCGIVHGDVKPQNVLIFNKPTLHAKIADFSHSVLDMGDTRRLVGGTWVYAAPEWEKAAPTAQLLMTDIYSYGLIFSGLVLGLSLEQCIRRDPPFGPSMPFRQAVEKLKNEDRMKGYLTRQLHLVDQQDSDSDLAEFSIIHKIWENTTNLDPGTRSLDEVVKLLGGREQQQRGFQKMEDSMLANAISIPYHSLHQLGAVFLDHIVDALLVVAESPRDTRRAAAWVELAVCHASGITRHSGLQLGGDRWRASAALALLNAAELGDPWARVVALRVSETLGQLIPERHDIQGWLFDAASKGSSIALESLVEVNQGDAMEALQAYRKTFCGNPSPLYHGVESKPEFMENPGLIVNARRDTILHWIASIGDTSMLRALSPSLLNEALVNSRNEQGDTPLLCATRAGHFDMLRMILDLGTDASLTNVLSENPLHFLTCLNGPDIPEAARLLVEAGADPGAEATGYSGNTYLDSRPRGRGCPRLRAIFANNAHALSTLIELTAHSLSASAAYEAIPLAIQRTLLAWALRLHLPEILEVLEWHFGGTRLFYSLGQTYLWNNGRRYSLPELCIIGGVSASPSSGLDIPEPVFRIISHGRNYIKNLEASLGFLARHEPTIFVAPCDKARNALFFAIRENRTNAVRFLGSLLPWTAQGSLFNSPYNRWDRCKEIHGLLYQTDTDESFENEDLSISKKKKLQQMLDAARREGGARSIISVPRSSQDTLIRLSQPEDRYDAASDDGYENPDEDSDLDTGSGVIEDACPHVRVRYDYQGRVWQKPGEKTAASYHPDLHGLPMGDGSDDGPDRTTGDGFSSRPTNYRQMEGVVDAVLMSILYDRRNVFHLLLAGEAKATMQRGDRFPCFVGPVKEKDQYNDITVKAMVEAQDASNLVSYFPVQVWRSCVLGGNADPEDFEPFDGIIRYSVMYMTAISLSIHRDVQLAKILVSSMPETGVRGACEWAAESTFESACLSLGSSLDEPPLYHAAVRGWTELAMFLMEHGASPQSPVWHNQVKRLASPRSILSTLCSETRRNNKKSVLQNLLMMAAQSGIKKTITIKDVNQLLLERNRDAEDSGVRWTLSKRRILLRWVSHYDSPSADYIKLWEAISAANRAQQEKIRLPSTTRADGRYTARNNPVFAAALRRDLVALQHLLDLDDTFDVSKASLHGEWRRPCPRGPRWWLQNWDWVCLLFRPPRATPLDVVSWTANVDPSRCDESALRLKAHDARIAAFLAARGATRGPDYVFEVLLARVLLQHVVLPLMVLPLVGYCLYLSGAWAAVVIRQASDTREAAHSQASAADEVRSATGTMFSVHCVVAVGIPILMFFDYIILTVDRRRRPETERDTRCCTLIRMTVWAVLVAGALGNLIALSILGTGSEAGRVFGASVLAFFSLEIVMLAIAVLISLFCLTLFFGTRGHLAWLTNEVQDGSPFKYTWMATRSAFSPPANGMAAVSRRGNGALARQWELDGIMAR